MAGHRLALALGDLSNTVERSRRIPLPTLPLRTMPLYGHEPGLRRRLTSLAVTTTMAAGRRDTPALPTEHALDSMQTMALGTREKAECRVDKPA